MGPSVIILWLVFLFVHNFTALVFLLNCGFLVTACNIVPLSLSTGIFTDQGAGPSSLPCVNS